MCVVSFSLHRRHSFGPVSAVAIVALGSHGFIHCRKKVMTASYSREVLKIQVSLWQTRWLVQASEILHRLLASER